MCLRPCSPVQCVHSGQQVFEAPAGCRENLGFQFIMAEITRCFLELVLTRSEGDPTAAWGGGPEESAGSILAAVNHGELGIPSVLFHTI